VKVLTMRITDKGIRTYVGNVCGMFARNSHDAVVSRQ